MPWENEAVDELVIPTGATSPDARIVIRGDSITQYAAGDLIIFRSSTVDPNIFTTDDAPPYAFLQGTALTYERDGQRTVLDQDDHTFNGTTWLNSFAASSDTDLLISALGDLVFITSSVSDIPHLSTAVRQYAMMVKGLNQQHYVQAVPFAAAAAANATVNFDWPVRGFDGNLNTDPQITHSVKIGANLDVLSNLQSVAFDGAGYAISATFRLFQRTLTPFTNTAQLHVTVTGDPK